MTYAVAAYTPGKITNLTFRADMDEAQRIAQEYVTTHDSGHIAIIGESGKTAEYWVAINGTPTRFDARWNHMAYRDMLQAIKNA
jgi:hypothetical protein